MPAPAIHGSALRRYALLAIPEFRLQAILRETPHAPVPTPPPTLPSPRTRARAKKVSTPAPTPRAVLEGSSANGTLLEVDPHAAAYGLHPGMPATQAVARCPALLLLTASPSAEHSLQTDLLRFAETLSPRVEKQANGHRWLLDLSRLHTPANDWTTWANTALRRLLARVSVHGRLGIAPQPALALCAARRANPVLIIDDPAPFIASLRFSELDLSPPLLQHLAEWGLSTLGELLALPRQDVRERLGPEVDTLWEMACDTRESILQLETFPDPLHLTLPFETPVETAPPLLFGLNRLLEQLCARLRLLHRAAASLHLQLRLDQGPVYERQFAIPAPTREETVLLRILQTHLETLRFNAPVTEVSLLIQDSIPHAHQLSLFENPLRDPNRFSETLARLRALAGENAVGIPLHANSHHPAAFRLEDPLPLLSTPANPHQKPSRTSGLPLRRFRPPVPADISLARHVPVHLRSHALSGPILDTRGPFRLSGDWWDAHPWETEEWDILLGGAARGLYRISLNPLAAPASNETAGSPLGTWFIEGCYDAAQWPLPPPPSPSKTPA